jgi:hypothetical protein
MSRLSYAQLGLVLTQAQQDALELRGCPRTGASGFGYVAWPSDFDSIVLKPDAEWIRLRAEAKKRNEAYAKHRAAWEHRKKRRAIKREPSVRRFRKELESKFVEPPKPREVLYSSAPMWVGSTAELELALKEHPEQFPENYHRPGYAK